MTSCLEFSVSAARWPRELEPDRAQNDENPWISTAGLRLTSIFVICRGRQLVGRDTSTSAYAQMAECHTKPGANPFAAKAKSGIARFDAHAGASQAGFFVNSSFPRTSEWRVERRGRLPVVGRRWAFGLILRIYNLGRRLNA